MVDEQEKKVVKVIVVESCAKCPIGREIPGDRVTCTKYIHLHEGPGIHDKCPLPNDTSGEMATWIVKAATEMGFEPELREIWDEHGDESNLECEEKYAMAGGEYGTIPSKIEVGSDGWVPIAQECWDNLDDGTKAEHILEHGDF